MCLCSQRVSFDTSQGMMMFCDWKHGHKSGINNPSSLIITNQHVHGSVFCYKEGDKHAHLCSAGVHNVFVFNSLSLCVYVLHASILCFCASFRPCVWDWECIFLQYLRYLLMDFHQTFFIGASWSKDEFISFWGQRSRSHYHGGGVQHSTLPLSSGF